MTVTTTGGIAGEPVGWIATASASDFTSDAATVGRASLGYDPGTANDDSGFGDGCVAGGPAALGTPMTAFTCNASPDATTTSVSWDPTVSVVLSPFAIAGLYAGTVTHSVA